MVASSLALNSATLAATTSLRAPALRFCHCCWRSILRKRSEQHLRFDMGLKHSFSIQGFLMHEDRTLQGRPP